MLERDGTRRNVHIDHRFFSDEQDALTLVEGIKVARSILASPVFADIRGPEILPGPDVVTDDEILAYLRAEALTVYHPVGTAKMGKDTMAFPDAGPDAFIGKEKVADYFVAYAEMIAAPIRCGVEVRKVQRLVGRPGFQVETSDGVIEARSVVAATGAFQHPVIPSVVPNEAGPMQIHSSAYRNPGQLPAGAVLVVGSGSSGVQIADELQRAGRRVYLSVGPHDRPPRAYRERDFCWWLGVLGKWDAQAPAPGTEHVTIAVSGARGGQTIDFRRLAAQGITLVGRTESYKDGVLGFAPDLTRNIARGDANYMVLCLPMAATLSRA